MLAEFGAQHGLRAGACVLTQRHPVPLVGSENLFVPAAVEHEPTVVACRPRHLRSQSGFADAGLPADQREYPDPRSSPVPGIPEHAKLVRPADEGRVRRVVQPAQVHGVRLVDPVGVSRFAVRSGQQRGVGGSQRGERLGEAGYHQLPDPLGPIEVLQPVLTEIADVEARGQTVLDERVRGLRQQNLTTMSRGTQPGGAMHAEPDETAGPWGWFGGVDAHPDADPAAGRPGVGRQGALSRHSRDHRVLGRAECDEERVTLSVDLPPAGHVECVTLQTLAFGQDLTIKITKPADEPGRALDVGEQQCHRARRCRVRARIGLLRGLGFRGLSDCVTAGNQPHPRTGLRAGLVHRERSAGRAGGRVGGGHLVPPSIPRGLHWREGRWSFAFGPCRQCRLPVTLKRSGLRYLRLVGHLG